MVSFDHCLIAFHFSASGYYVVWSFSRTHPLRNTYTSIDIFYTLTMLVSVACTSTSIALDLQALDDEMTQF
jgi:hypothetical protein